MILYFSGTGNSAYAAKRIASALGDESLNLFDGIRTGSAPALRSDAPWLVVTPTYAWRIPRIVEHWLERAHLAGSRDIRFVMTCGDSIGNADKYLRRLCAKIHMEYRGCMGIAMPENYIALFATPSTAQALEIIDRAEAAIDRAAQLIQADEPFPRPAVSPVDRLCSGVVNRAFYPLFVHAKKFRVKPGCTACGRCVHACPLENIRLEQGKPVWGSRCTHCMACICGCPREVIEYGRHSEGLPRYICPKKI